MAQSHGTAVRVLTILALLLGSTAGAIRRQRSWNQLRFSEMTLRREKQNSLAVHLWRPWGDRQTLHWPGFKVIVEDPLLSRGFQQVLGSDGKRPLGRTRMATLFSILLDLAEVRIARLPVPEQTELRHGLDPLRTKLRTSFPPRDASTGSAISDADFQTLELSLMPFLQLPSTVTLRLPNDLIEDPQVRLLLEKFASPAGSENSPSTNGIKPNLLGTIRRWEEALYVGMFAELIRLRLEDQDWRAKHLRKEWHVYYTHLAATSLKELQVRLEAGFPQLFGKKRAEEWPNLFKAPTFRGLPVKLGTQAEETFLPISNFEDQPPVVEPPTFEVMPVKVEPSPEEQPETDVPTFRGKPLL